MGIEIIAGLIAAAGVTGEIGATGIALSTIAAYAVVGGVVVGGALILQNAEKQHANEQQTVRQSCPPRQRIYGRALVGGAYYFFRANGGTLSSGFLLCEGPIDAFEQHWFNDQISPDGGATYGHADTWPWNQQIQFDAQRGTIPQGVQGTLQYNFPDWDASHTLTGIANVVMTCYLPGNPSKNFPKSFPSGVPQYRAVIRGARVYDPRDVSQIWATSSTWKWSANPALCILDYLTVTIKDGLGRAIARGMGVGTGAIDIPSFIAMANLCDQGVAISAAGAATDGLSAGTSSETRYVLWGSYTLDEEPKDVLARMLATCDGELYMTGAGKIALRGGQWSVPAVTLTADCILDLEVQKGRDKLSKYNQLRVRYTSLINQYQQTEGDPWDDVAAQAAFGEVLPQDFDCKLTPSYTMALRLAKIKMAKDNPEWLLTVTTNYMGLQALGERIVTLQFPDLSINDTFFVSSFEIMEDGCTCKIGLGSLSADAYEWSIAEEKSGAGAATVNVATPYVPATPTGLALSLNRIDTGSGALATIEASVTPPADTGLAMVAQYRIDGTTAWLDMSVDNDAYTATSNVVSDNTLYDVQVCFQSYALNEGAFTAGSINVVVDDASPGSATGFSEVDTSTMPVKAGLSWTTPSSPNYYATDVFRGATPALSAATLQTTIYGSPNQDLAYNAVLNTGPNYYWVTCKNRSGVGTTSGPIEVTR